MESQGREGRFGKEEGRCVLIRARAAALISAGVAAAQSSSKSHPDHPLADPANDLGELRFGHKLRSLLEIEPRRIALSLFWPSISLARDYEKKDVDAHDPGVAPVELLFILVAADRVLAVDPSDEAGLFERLALGCLSKGQLAHRPPFRDDPTPCRAGGDEQHLWCSVLVQLKRQRADLLAMGSLRGFPSFVLGMAGQLLGTVSAGYAQAGGVTEVRKCRNDQGHRSRMGQ